MKHSLPLELSLVALLAAACGSDASTIPNSLEGAAATIYADDCMEDTGKEVTIYSGRSEDLVQPVLDAFECATGISTSTNFGDPTDLALALTEEGDRTPADIFLSKSPGAVGFLRNEGLLSPLSDDITNLVDETNVAADNTWVGITGRQRVLVYNVDQVDAANLPSSVFELTDEKYRGRVGIPATNGSFQDWFTVFRAQEGDAVAIEWLDAMVANDAIKTESNRPTVDAVGRGEFDFGLVNHYYNFQEAEALGDAHRAENHTFASDDIGSLVIVTAAAITSSSENVDAAEEFISFMLSEEAQTFFTTDTLEYPLAAGVDPAPVLPPLDDDGADIDVDFDTLGNGLQRTVEIIDESGING
jgi:iron(III) transport system substrate-binding protein